MGVGKGFDAADSWNVALLFLIYAVLSVGIEHGVHWIKHLVHGKKTLMLVIHKAEEELFLLGTVSFLLLVFEDIIINNSCVKSSIFDGDNWALCHVSKSGYYGSSSNSTGSYSGRRRLQGAVGGGDGICPDGKEPFFSASLLHHVHIFIFLLAISHVLYTAATLTLGRWRLKDMMSRRTEHLRVTMERVAKITGKDAHEISAAMERRRMEDVRTFRRDGDGDKMSRKGSLKSRRERDRRIPRIIRRHESLSRQDRRRHRRGAQGRHRPRGGTPIRGRRPGKNRSAPRPNP